MKFIRHLIDVTSIMQLSKSQRRIVFYSEGKEYWVHLEGLLKEFLNLSNVPACYISSGEDDPGLFYRHPNLKSFKIDEGGFRDWLFKNIDADVMVMTMPDLDQYQVKRSKKPVHYVYVQHSLVSLHMVYRKGAFDKYDTIFCAGPHHIKEVRAIEKKYNLPPKKLVEHGYGRIDSIIDSIEKSTEKTTSDPPKILIAPSWGENALIESIGEKVVLHLLETGFRVTLRPHPRTVKFAKDKLNSIFQQHEHNPNFSYEINVASQKSLHQSDLMISDWSGAALDYAFGLGKPVLFIDVPRKINNQEYESINIDPFEVWIRNKIGRVQRLEDLESLNRSVYDLLSSKTCFDQKSLAEKNIFNLGNSSRIGAAHLMKII